MALARLCQVRREIEGVEREREQERESARASERERERERERMEDGREMRVSERARDESEKER